MLDWLLNPEGVPYWGWVIFWIGLILILPIAFIAGLVHAWRSQEKRDGKR